MNASELDQWLDKVRRRPLSPAEADQLESLLAQHPDWREPWRQEETLTRLLASLPEPPLSPGFTPRVLRAIARPTAFPTPTVSWLAWLRSPRPALGFATAAVALALAALALVTQQRQTQNRIAHSVADISRQLELAASATDLPAVELLQDFEAIYRLAPTQAHADEELLAAFELAALQ
jgi:anti-sigma factor RsiW